MPPRRSWTAPESLAALLRGVADAVTKEVRVALFVQLTLAAEATNESALALVEKLMMFDNGRQRVMSAVSNFLKDADVDAYAASNPFLATHKYLLVLLKREAAHVIDPALEETVLKLRMTGANAFAQLRDQIDAGHMIELDGKKHPPLGHPRHGLLPPTRTCAGAPMRRNSRRTPPSKPAWPPVSTPSRARR